MTRPASPLRALAWLALLVAAAAGLLRAGDQLPLPPWPAPDPSVTWRWLERTDPAVTAFALIRLAALVVTAWLLASTLILVAGHLLRLPALVATADRITVPAARRLIGHAVGAGLAVTLASTAVTAVTAATVPAASASPFAPGDTGGSPGTSTPSPPVLHVLPDAPVLVHLGPAVSASDDAAATGAPPLQPPLATDAPAQPPPPPAPAVPASPPPAATVEGVEPVEPAEHEPASGADRPAPGPMTSLPVVEPDQLDEHHHTIAAGDHLWGVAEQTLASRWSRSPEPAEIAAYLHRLIAANRGVLAVPDEPDLVFPGQVFVLPEVPDGSRGA